MQRYDNFVKHDTGKNNMKDFKTTTIENAMTTEIEEKHKYRIRSKVFILIRDDIQQVVRVIEAKIKDFVDGLYLFNMQNNAGEDTTRAEENIYQNREDAEQAARKISQKLYSIESYPKPKKLTRKDKKNRKEMIKRIKASQERKKYANLTDYEFAKMQKSKKHAHIWHIIVTITVIFASAYAITQIIEKLIN